MRMFQNDTVLNDSITEEVHCEKFASAQEGGSLSDSGISDSGSEQELSEREHRLAALRRLTRSLETQLPPESESLTEILKRIGDVETELRDLQKQCRELIVRTATADIRGSAKRTASQVHYPAEWVLVVIDSFADTFAVINLIIFARVRRESSCTNIDP